MFFLARPTPSQIQSVLQSQRDARPLYTRAGANHDFHTIELGAGDSVFATARDALQNWKMMDIGWLQAFASGDDVVLVIRHYGFWSINVNRVLYGNATDSAISIVYATLPEHAESGEERFTVTRRPNGSVWYEIEAFSRPRHLLAKLAYPLSRALQRRFARDSMRHMWAICGGSGR